MVYCPTCSSYLPQSTTHCPSCGYRFAQAETGVTKRLVSEATLKCLRCGSMMELGFVLEHDPGTGYTGDQWVEGKLKLTWLGAIDTAGRRVFPIRTYRCLACGYLESYALPKHDG